MSKLKKEVKKTKKEKELLPMGTLSLEGAIRALETAFSIALEILHDTANCEDCHTKTK